MVLGPDTLRRLRLARDLLAGDEALGVHAIAARVGLSTFHLIRLFEAVFGLTPHQFRIARRLERARVLLALDSMPVTDVCLEVGFSSLGSFSTLFTRTVGSSPLAYRRRLRSLVQVPADLRRVVFPGCLSLMARLPPEAFRNFREAATPGRG